MTKTCSLTLSAVEATHHPRLGTFLAEMSHLLTVAALDVLRTPRLGAVRGEVAHLLTVAACDILCALWFWTVASEVTHLFTVATGNVLGILWLGTLLGHVAVYSPVSLCVLRYDCCRLTRLARSCGKSPCAAQCIRCPCGHLNRSEQDFQTEIASE